MRERPDTAGRLHIIIDCGQVRSAIIPAAAPIDSQPYFLGGGELPRWCVMRTRGLDVSLLHHHHRYYVNIITDG
jgi:hypothetical protein